MLCSTVLVFHLCSLNYLFLTMPALVSPCKRAVCCLIDLEGMVLQACLLMSLKDISSAG